MPGRLASLLLPLAVLAGCSGLSRTARMETKLTEAGIKPKLARCLAPKLAHDLDDDQLRALAQAAKAPGEGHGAKALRRKLAAIDDPQVADVVSRAALGCTIMG